MGHEDRRIVLRFRDEDIELEIQVSGIQDLEGAYLDLLSVKTELKKIRQKHRVLILADTSRAVASEYWIRAENGPKIKDNVELPLRIILSLLDSYPECKQGSIIASEINSTHPTVSRYFTGERGNHSQYFERCNGDYRLSEQGVFFIADWLGISHQSE
jgi:hypothetical protein